MNLKKILVQPIQLIKNINKKNELVRLKNELNYICDNYHIKIELKNQLKLISNENSNNLENIKKIINKLNCNKSELCIQYSNNYENLFFRLKLYDNCIGKTINDID